MFIKTLLMPDESHKDKTCKSRITLVQLYFVIFVQFYCVCLDVELMKIFGIIL